MNDFLALCKAAEANAEYHEMAIQYESAEILMETAPTRHLDLFISGWLRDIRHPTNADFKQALVGLTLLA